MTCATAHVSVIVPTRDRATSLARCLAALERQTAESFEVIVVDDASRDATAVAAAVAAAPHARLVAGAGRGPAAARNLGARAARGSVLAFTDDDCEPVPGWLDHLTRRLQDGEAAAGPTRAPSDANPAVAASQTIASYLAEATRERATGRMSFAPTSNLACHAHVFRTLPFDARYPLAAGEDRDWCARLSERGGTLLSAPEATVRHHQDLTFRTFWRQQVRYGRGAYRFHRTQPRFHGPGFYVGLIRAGFAAGPRAGALVALAQLATGLGLVREAATEPRLRWSSPPRGRLKAAREASHRSGRARRHR